MIPIGKIILIALALFFILISAHLKINEKCGLLESLILGVIFTLGILSIILVIVEIVIGIVFLWALII